MIVINKEKELANKKNEKLNEINTSCALEITSGFMSNAVDNEVFLKYESEQIDQLNLIGLVSSNKDALLKSGLLAQKENENDEDVYIWDFRPHTALQLKKVFDDGVIYKEALLLKAYKLKAQVSEATTIEAVNAISW